MTTDPEQPHDATEEELSLELLDEVSGGASVLNTVVNLSFN
jgi:hypothetical protein